MKILKFKNKQKFKYNKKIIVKDLILLLSVGIHQFERLKRQKVKFNLDDPKKLFHMKSDNRREIYEYFMKDKKNFDYLISLFRQKYDS